MIKRFIIAIILLVLICGGLVGFNIFRSRAIENYFATAPRPTSTVSTQDVKPVTWTPNIAAIGTVNAARGVDLTVQVTGVVTDIRFKANQKVKTGDVLLQLDDEVERADLEASKAQASLDKVAQTRAQELQRRGVGSVQALDAASAAATSSTATLAKLQAVLDQKQLKAPFNGTTGIARVDLGQYLSPGTTVVTLQDLDTMRVDFTVPEQDLGQLKIDQPVKLSLNQADWRYTGKITGIDPKVDPSSRLVSLRAEVANTDGELTPGQFVQVQVELPKEDNVLAISQTAVVTSLYGDYVFVVAPAEAKPANTKPAGDEAAQSQAKPETKADTSKTEAPAATGGEAKADADAQPPAGPALVAKQVFLKIGRRSQGLVEITSGLKPGDQIVTSGQNRLSNGSPVKVDNAVDVTTAPPPQGTQDTSPAP